MYKPPTAKTTKKLYPKGLRLYQRVNMYVSIFSLLDISLIYKSQWGLKHTTNNHPYYKQPPILQTTTHTTNNHPYHNHHPYHKQPPIPQTTTHTINNHLYYKQPPILQTTIHITNKERCQIKNNDFLRRSVKGKYMLRRWYDKAPTKTKWATYRKRKTIVTGNHKKSIKTFIKQHSSGNKSHWSGDTAGPLFSNTCKK